MCEQFFVKAQGNNELLEFDESNATLARIYSKRHWHEVDSMLYSKFLIYCALKIREYTKDAADPLADCPCRCWLVDVRLLSFQNLRDPSGRPCRIL